MKKNIPEIKENKGTFQVHPAFLAGDILHFKAELEVHKRSNQTATIEKVRWMLPTVVSIFESFYKEIFARYIDCGEPYIGRIIKLHERNKPDVSFETLMGLRKSFSIGDLYAYSCKFNSFTEIRKNYEIICQCDYVEKVRGISFDLDRGDVAEVKRAQGTVTSIFSDVEKVFQMRHALIHEYPATQVTPTLDEGLKYLDSAWLVLMVTDRMFWDDTKLPNPFPPGFGQNR